MRIYKKGQGKYTRMLTLAGGMLIAVLIAIALGEFLIGKVSTLVRFAVPSVLVLASGAFVLWMINRPKSADFLIATEGEMKKVSWSSKKEVVGSTKVVIVTTFILAIALFGVDVFFSFIFGWLKIM